MLEKPKLFVTLKEFWITMIFLFLLLIVRLYFIYGDYKEFKEKPFFYTDVQVIQSYEKWKDDNYYTILKLYSPILDLRFFSRTKIHSKDLTSKIRVKLFPHVDMKFLDYLGTPFIFSNVNDIYDEKKNPKANFLHLIEKQHSDKDISSFYKAIYFATPLSKSLRESVSSLGVSHLIALSGFHLSILSALLFFLIRLGYRPLQQRFFPYRFDLYDIGFIVLFILGFYVWFVGFPPSLLRSYVMLIAGWVLLILGMELVSFSFLAMIVLVLLIIFPKLLLSLAFWFSIAGVFYIFLLLHYFSHINKYLMTLLISFGLFILMLPIVHTFFPITSPLQLYSPLLSLGFTFFYPISILFHLLGIGGIFDSYLQELFTLHADTVAFKLEKSYLFVYLILSFLSIYWRWFFYMLYFVALLFALWLFILVL